MAVDKLRQLSDIERLNLWSLGEFEDEELIIISDNMPSLQQLKVSMSLTFADSFHVEQAASTMQCKLLTVSLFMYRRSRRYQSFSNSNFLESTCLCWSGLQSYLSIYANFTSNEAHQAEPQVLHLFLQVKGKAS